MATNIVHENGDQLDVVVTSPASPKSGDPVLVGKLPGVALTDERADGTTTVKFNGTATLPVKGEGAAGNAAIANGDVVYYDGGTINADATNGTRYGYALAAVASAATTDILVKLGY